MPTIIRSAQSEQDVYEIARFIADDNPDAAFRWIDRIDEVLIMLASHPQAGSLRSELAPNVRSFPVGSYIVFYRAASDGIELVRVLHGARNLRRIFRRSNL